MAYIVRFRLLIRILGTSEELTTLQISVNAAILRDSGGTCVCSTNDGCTDDAVYLSCVSEVQRDLITTTASISALSSFLMGLLANLPVGMAPGLGLNAYVSLPALRTSSNHPHLARMVTSNLPHLHQFQSDRVY